MSNSEEYIVKNNRLYNKEGDVAVLYSPDYGAGWYSWNKKFPDCVFDSDIVLAVLNEDFAKAAELANLKFGSEFYSGGAKDLEVDWLKPGSTFRISEYDGCESIEILDSYILKC